MLIIVKVLARYVDIYYESEELNFKSIKSTINSFINGHKNKLREIMLKKVGK